MILEMCVKIKDGGKSWFFLSWIGDEPDVFSIMPASVRISDQEILITTRREGPHRYISTYRSKDNGISRKKLGNPVDNTNRGNRPALAKMRDGRLRLIYKYQAEVEDIKNGTDTNDIRAKLSNKGGKTWCRDYVLHDDGSGKDLGYPRVVQQADGKIVALYSFMVKETGPERYIAATILGPPTY